MAWNKVKTALFRSLVLTLFISGRFAGAQVLPDITPEEFSGIVAAMSEYGGSFSSDNWVTNELTYLEVLEPIERYDIEGGVYIGVGPGQNFSYITAIEPELAFIVDIRHQNRMQHLIYKILFEQADTRAGFLSLLFSMPLDPAVNLNNDGNIDAIVNYFYSARRDEEMLENTENTILNILDSKYKFGLTYRDSSAISKVLDYFYYYNVGITYNGARRSWYPQLGDLLRMRTAEGIQKNPFNSIEDYRYLRNMQLENRIIPLTGNFAGSQSLRMLSGFLEKNNLTVSAFYVSNVEQYLLRNHLDWYGWSNNVRSLPITDRSVFIRWTHDGSGYNPQTRLQWIKTFIKNNDENRYYTYYDLVRLDYIK